MNAVEKMAELCKVVENLVAVLAVPTDDPVKIADALIDMLHLLVKRSLNEKLPKLMESGELAEMLKEASTT